MVVFGEGYRSSSCIDKSDVSEPEPICALVISGYEKVKMPAQNIKRNNVRIYYYSSKKMKLLTVTYTRLIE